MKAPAFFAIALAGALGCAGDTPQGGSVFEASIEYNRYALAEGETEAHLKDLSVRIEARQATAYSKVDGVGHLDLTEEEIDGLLALYTEQTVERHQEDSSGTAASALAPRCDSSDALDSEEELVCEALRLAERRIYVRFMKPPHLPSIAGYPLLEVTAPTQLTVESARLIVTLEALRARTLEEGLVEGS